MPKWLRALIAGYGAKKLGGGCLSTIVIFIVIYYALGTCNRPVTNTNNTRGSISSPAHHSRLAQLQQKDFTPSISTAIYSSAYAN